MDRRGGGVARLAACRMRTACLPAMPCASPPAHYLAHRLPTSTLPAAPSYTTTPHTRTHSTYTHTRNSHHRAAYHHLRPSLPAGCRAPTPTRTPYLTAWNTLRRRARVTAGTWDAGRRCSTVHTPPYHTHLLHTQPPPSPTLPPLAPAHLCHTHTHCTLHPTHLTPPPPHHTAHPAHHTHTSLHTHHTHTPPLLPATTHTTPHLHTHCHTTTPKNIQALPQTLALSLLPVLLPPPFSTSPTPAPPALPHPHHHHHLTFPTTPLPPHHPHLPPTFLCHTTYTQREEGREGTFIPPRSSSAITPYRSHLMAPQCLASTPASNPDATSISYMNNLTFSYAAISACGLPHSHLRHMRSVRHGRQRIATQPAADI